ncbi:hypothetical protein MESS2_p60009 [Mesorhizobium metallidurans STM 2683]|uniref:Uncharacterized protein n=1 Tax=Mesorhizobium metallidurans STM 2683 TaxID=1297569 RepID=M5EZN9_9HYPH|nr:hypothetical protein MESS2_p60009 [Mesorhizobium metallidurans STM 2683]
MLKPRKPAGNKRLASARTVDRALDCMTRNFVIEHGAVAIENNLLDKLRHGHPLRPRASSRRSIYLSGPPQSSGGQAPAPPMQTG